MIGSRTRSRELALQALFCWDTQPEGRVAAAETLAAAEAGPDVRAFARELLDGVVEHQQAIDDLITAAADNWSLQRLAVVDRNVLRLAVHELMHRDEVPARVSINEAIELGKRFSTAQSGAFINGVLDRIRLELGLEAEGPASEPVDDDVRPLDLPSPEPDRD